MVNEFAKYDWDQIQRWGQEKMTLASQGWDELIGRDALKTAGWP